MIVDTMSPNEMNFEIWSDYGNIQNTLERLTNEYDRERRRLKVNNTDVYSRTYHVKTKKKNTWIIVIGKAQSDEKYKNIHSLTMACLLYYYSPVGLRVFKIMLPSGLSVFNSHLFTRYNERMNLGFCEPLEIVKSFFTNNPSYAIKIIPQDNREFAIGVCREGLLLGELQEQRMWLVYKTFINRGVISLDQTKIENELINSLQGEIEQELNQFEFNRDNYKFKCDVFKGIL